MRPIDRLSPEVRKLLTKSRNRIAGLILHQPAPPPPPPPQIPIAKQQNAFIDITEPLTFGSGQRRDVAFKYFTGVPAATAFGMIWFANENDAIANRPLTETAEPRESPTQEFTPARPQPNTGTFQDGIVSIQVPELERTKTTEDYVGRIIIYQE